MEAKGDIALIGLAVMGQNLILNMADHGFAVAVLDVSAQATRRFVAGHKDTPGPLVGCGSDLRKFVASLQRPRKMVLLIPAGKPVDDMVKRLLPLLSRGDIVIDGGNSLWTDTIRREQDLAAKGIHEHLASHILHCRETFRQKGYQPYKLSLKIRARQSING